MLSNNEKAKELYEKRIAPYAGNISQLQKESIIELQELIFDIDEYGESTQSIDPLVVELFWMKIQHFLDGLKIEKDLQQLLLKDMRDYADIEINTRAGKRLTDYDIKSFYFLKSCDVRMQRHIIRYLNNETSTSSDEEVTKDILEEIEDDVDDLKEDSLSSLNGNRFLEALKLKDDSLIENYIIFINSLTNIPKDLVKELTNKIEKLKERGI